MPWTVSPPTVVRGTLKGRQTLRLNSRNRSAAKSSSSALSASSQLQPSALGPLTPNPSAAGCGAVFRSHAAAPGVRSGTALTEMESVYKKRSTASNAPALMPPMTASGSGAPCPDPNLDPAPALAGLPRASERSSSALKYSDRAARMHWWHLGSQKLAVGRKEHHYHSCYSTQGLPAAHIPLTVYTSQPESRHSF